MTELYLGFAWPVEMEELHDLVDGPLESSSANEGERSDMYLFPFSRVQIEELHFHLDLKSSF